MKPESHTQIVLICLCIVLLCAGFAWAYAEIFDVPVPAIQSNSSGTAPEDTIPLDSLEMSTTLDTSREGSTSDTPSQHTFLLWWPTLLFGCAFLCGWLARHLARASRLLVVNNLDYVIDATELDSIRPVAQEGEKRVAELDKRIAILQQQLKSLTNQTQSSRQPGDNTREIEILKEKNLAKAEIIKTLEQLVSENREKWLHRDELENEMNQRIKELTRELNSAMKIVHSDKKLPLDGSNDSAEDIT